MLLETEGTKYVVVVDKIWEKLLAIKKNSF